MSTIIAGIAAVARQCNWKWCLIGRWGPVWQTSSPSLSASFVCSQFHPLPHFLHLRLHHPTRQDVQRKARESESEGKRKRFQPHLFCWHSSTPKSTFTSRRFSGESLTKKTESTATIPAQPRAVPHPPLRL